MPLSLEEMTRSIARTTGWPRERAEAEARRQLGVTPSVPVKIVDDKPPLITLPVSLRLPWSMLVSDDDKYGVLNGVMLLKPEYRAAKTNIAATAIGIIGDRTPLAIPLSLYARVFVPDNRVHDVPNFGKCVHDALEKVVYTNDRWLYRTIWERVGVDVDAPRAEVSISPYLASLA